MLEKKVEERLKKELQENNYWYIKPQQNKYSKRGVPDILANINGIFNSFEVKGSNSHPLSLIQLINGYQIIQGGGRFFLIHNDFTEIENTLLLEVTSLKNPYQKLQDFDKQEIQRLETLLKKLNADKRSVEIIIKKRSD